MLFLDKAAADPKRKIVIVLPSGSGAEKIVSGFITSDFNFSGGSQWNDPNSMAQGAIDEANAAINGASRLFNLAGAQMGQQRLASPMDSVYTWQAATRPQLNIDIVVPAIREDDDVRAKVRSLLAAAYPERNFAGYSAPGGYATDAVGNASNTCILTIGNWFRAEDLVIEQVNASFSKAVMKNGLPRLASLAVTLSPFRIPDKEEVVNYFS